MSGASEDGSGIIAEPRFVCLTNRVGLGSKRVRTHTRNSAHSKQPAMVAFGVEELGVSKICVNQLRKEA